MKRLLPLTLVTLVAPGCVDLVGGSGQVPEGHRLVSGRLYIADDGIVGRQVTGLQVAAAAVVEGNDGLAPKVSVSQVLDPEKGGAANTAAAPFALAVPVEQAFTVVLQVPTSSGRGPGELLGVYRFESGYGEETGLIPAGEGALELGTLEARDGDPSTRADNRLEGAVADNPLDQIDSDDDDVADLSDDDDDGDGVADAVDSDVAGDGVEDAVQGLEALPDQDASGIPDAFEGA